MGAKSRFPHGRQDDEALKPHVQYAALPYRVGGGLEILLITSRDTGRWVIPKGWPMKGKTAWAAAGREALEEAGVVGEIGRKALGAFDYVKFLPSGEGRACRVKVFPLKVVDQREVWREKDQRTPQWFVPAEAARSVHEPGLARIIRRFAKSMAGGKF